MTLDVSQGDPKNPILNFRAEVTEDIMDPLILHIRMYQLENGVYESMQVNVSIGLCQFLAKTKKYPMVKFVISELSKTNNIPTQCPIKKVCIFLNFELQSETCNQPGNLLYQKLGSKHGLVGHYATIYSGRIFQA